MGASGEVERGPGTKVQVPMARGPTPLSSSYRRLSEMHTHISQDPASRTGSRDLHHVSPHVTGPGRDIWNKTQVNDAHISTHRPRGTCPTGGILQEAGSLEDPGIISQPEVPTASTTASKGSEHLAPAVWVWGSVGRGVLIGNV